MRPCVVIDTNVLLQAVPTRGRYAEIYRALADRKFELIVSQNILYEYEEVLTLLGAADAWPKVQRVLMLLHNRGRYVRYVEPSYNWHLISHRDPDDDKFVDAAVCGQAEFIITEDRHFKDLKQCTLVTPKPKHPNQFMCEIVSMNSNTVVDQL